MDMYEIRRRNVEWLCEKYGRDIVAERLGYTDTNYINGIISTKSKTKVGNNAAVKFERTFPEIGQQPGWMSIPQWSAGDRDVIRREVENLADRHLEAVRAYLETLNRR